MESVSKDTNEFHQASRQNAVEGSTSTQSTSAATVKKVAAAELEGNKRSWQALRYVFSTMTPSQIALFRNSLERAPPMQDVANYSAAQEWAPGGHLMESVGFGDLILIARRHPTCRFLQVSVNSCFDHVAVVCGKTNPGDSKQDIIVVHSDGYPRNKPPPPDYFTGAKNPAVLCMPLSDLINGEGFQYICVRRLKSKYRKMMDDTTEMQKHLWNLLREVQHLPYPLDRPFDNMVMWNLMFEKANNSKVDWNVAVDKQTGVFCTQIVGEFLLRCGFMPRPKTDGAGEGRWVPTNCSQICVENFSSSGNCLNEFYEEECFIKIPNVTPDPLLWWATSVKIFSQIVTKAEARLAVKEDKNKVDVLTRSKM